MWLGKPQPGAGHAHRRSGIRRTHVCMATVGSQKHADGAERCHALSPQALTQPVEVGHQGQAVCLALPCTQHKGMQHEAPVHRVHMLPSHTSSAGCHSAMRLCIRQHPVYRQSWLRLSCNHQWVLGESRLPGRGQHSHTAATASQTSDTRNAMTDSSPTALMTLSDPICLLSDRGSSAPSTTCSSKFPGTLWSPLWSHSADSVQQW